MCTLSVRMKYNNHHHSKSLFPVKIKDNGTQKAVQRQRMGILLCEQNFRNVWIQNESVRAEIGQILHTDTHPHTHTTAAKLVVRISRSCNTSTTLSG